MQFISKQYQNAKEYIRRTTQKLYGKALALYQNYKSKSRVEQTRFLVLVLSLTLILDYLMFCLHADKNIFNIFPTFPVLDSRREVNIYLPDASARTIMKETRRISMPESKDELAVSLFNFVVRGSRFDNTSHVVPIATQLRKIWFVENRCVFDIALSPLKEAAIVVPGAEEAFKKALEKTITENIPSVTEVTVLVNGIPSARLW
jgi:hypothetical protein